METPIKVTPRAGEKNRYGGGEKPEKNTPEKSPRPGKMPEPQKETPDREHEIQPVHTPNPSTHPEHENMPEERPVQHPPKITKTPVDKSKAFKP